MSDQTHKAVNFTCVNTAADNATVCEISDDAAHYDTWILGSSAGVIDVYVSLDGTSYQTAPIALLDLGSTTPSTMVVKTVAGGNFAFRGKFRKIKLLQETTNVSGAALIGYRTT
jgi:hypothetical protein